MGATVKEIRKLKRKLAALPATHADMPMWEVEEIENAKARIEEEVKRKEKQHVYFRTNH